MYILVLRPWLVIQKLQRDSHQAGEKNISRFYFHIVLVILNVLMLYSKRNHV